MTSWLPNEVANEIDRHLASVFVSVCGLKKYKKKRLKINFRGQRLQLQKQIVCVFTVFVNILLQYTM